MIKKITTVILSTLFIISLMPTFAIGFIYFVFKASFLTGIERGSNFMDYVDKKVNEL